jgi:4-hydroxy-3-methylbut-2-enyl diphosphate reductase
MKDKDQGVIVAPCAGFCPGVKKAIDCVLQLEAAGKKPVYTIGPLIHNKQVTDDLEAKGITSIDTLDQTKNKNGVLVIRAHGITPQFQKEVESQGMEVIDSTCPLVKKVHNVIEEYAKQGYDTVIVGDAGHAEVTGLLGYTRRGKNVVVANIKEAKKLPYFKKVNIVAQTTQNEETFYKVAEIIKANAGVCVISNTICEPTKQRQRETIENAKNADLVIVVGGRHSANTARLAKLCGKLCPKVIHVESADEINKDDILSSRKVFITAGASTPNWVIEKVAERVKAFRRKRNSLPSLLQNAWNFIVKSSVFTSFAAVCLTYVCMKLQNIKADYYLYLLTWLAIFTLTIINKEERALIFKNKKVFCGAIALGIPAAFLVSLRYNAYVYMPTILFLVLGALYPLRYKLKSFSSFPGTKDIATALGWSFVCVYIPAASQGLVFTKSTALAFTYGLLLVFTRSVILSIGTEYKDIILGKESFYKAFGLTKTKIAITLIILALTAVLIKLLLMGWKTNIVTMLLLGHIYTVYTAIRSYTKKIPRSTASETVIDGQFCLLALLTFTAVNLI